jgi:phage terminase small subunit
MAIGGNRPKPSVLKLIAGNPGGRRLHDEPIPRGKPRKPAWLTGRGAELWTEVSGFGFWLTVADAYKLASWCDRQADFENPRKRSKWTAADRREHRAAGSELGLDPSSRARLGPLHDPHDAQRDPASKFLT